MGQGAEVLNESYSLDDDVTYPSRLRRSARRNGASNDSISSYVLTSHSRETSFRCSHGEIDSGLWRPYLDDVQLVTFPKPTGCNH